MSREDDGAALASAAATLDESLLIIALERRATISTAVGIIMERYTMDYDTASRRLTRSSSVHNATVHDLAQQLVREGWAADL